MQKSTKIKSLGLALVSALSLGLVGSASAWGPERPTFTMEDPATYPTFNSITNNPTIGDERDFVRIGEINTDVTNLTNEVEIIPGKQYLVYVYFHNNASATYNDSAHNNSGVALATRMSTTFPTIIKAGEKGTVSATITANNSDPLSVWDEAYFTTNTSKVMLNYVAGSAKIYNDWGANGTVMSDTIFTEEGALLGLNSLNGVIPGCEEYHGVVSYVVEARELTGSVEKSVSLDGENYLDSAEVTPGTEVYYRLTIKNTGDVALSNVTIKDALPEGLSLVPGSVVLTANESTTQNPLSDDLVTNGFNLGTLGTGNTVYITYRAKVSDDVDCGKLSLVNSANLTYDSEVATGDTVEDAVTVNVEKDGCVIDDGDNLPDEIVNTGPAEIIMAVVIILGIAAGGFYFWRTHRTLKTVEKVVSGTPKDTASKDGASKDGTTSTTPAEPKSPATPDDKSKK